MADRENTTALAAFTIGLDGFMVWAKVDQRPTDRLLPPFVINVATELRAPIFRFEEAAEHAYFQDAARKDLRRASTR